MKNYVWTQELYDKYKAMAKEMKKSGKSYKEIAAELTKQGYITAKGTKIKPHSVYIMLNAKRSKKKAKKKLSKKEIAKAKKQAARQAVAREAIPAIKSHSCGQGTAVKIAQSILGCERFALDSRVAVANFILSGEWQND